MREGEKPAPVSHQSDSHGPQLGIPSGFPILPVGGSRCAKRPDLPRLRPETMCPGPGPGVLSGDRVLPGDLLLLLGLSFPGLLAGHPVPCGANLAPGLPRDAGVFAVPALSALFGLLSPLPLVATAIGRPAWVLASELFVPLAVLLGRLLLSLVRDGAILGIPCCCSAAFVGLGSFS